MVKKTYNVGTLLLDLDGFLPSLNSIFCEYDGDQREIDYLGKNSSQVSYEICKIGNFLFSVVALNIPVGIVSSRNIAFIKQLLKMWIGLSESDFSVIISGQDVLNTALLERIITDIVLEFPDSDCMIVGTYSFHFKLKSLKRVLRLCLRDFYLDNLQDRKDLSFDFILDGFSDILSVIKKGVFLAPGKLPNTLLNDFLSIYKFEDPSVIVGPSVGEDTAAVDIEENEVLVLKSDPITFATDNIGYYAVLVNSNDMATSGAIPRWMLTSIMFPPGISVYDAQTVFNELYNTCSTFHISLCGGHTEITDAVSRPIVVGTIIGTVKRKDFIDKRNVRAGDVVIMTKGAAIEGTAIIASKFRALLLDKGMSSNTIDKCLEFRKQISILNEAKIAWKNSGVSALHDVTEGGVVTALIELSKASGYGIRVYLDSIIIYSQTRDVCDLLELNPLGLIGSGSLLICCRQNKAKSILYQIRRESIRATIVGKIINEGGDIEAIESGRLCRLPRFEVDEITRLFRK